MDRTATVTEDETGTIEGEFGIAEVSILKDEIVRVKVTAPKDPTPSVLDIMLIHDNCIEISSEGNKIFFNSGEYFMTVYVIMDGQGCLISDLSTHSN